MKERAYPVYTVNKHAEGLLVGGHPWVYENDILHAPDTEPENGTLADVISPKGAYLGTGFVSLHSKIRVRLISRNANDTFDTAFWRRRVEYAWAYRKTVLEPADLTACRVIFGEADQFPGLTVDRFHDILVTQTLSVGMEKAQAGAVPPAGRGAAGRRPDHCRHLRAKRRGPARQGRAGAEQGLVRPARRDPPRQHPDRDLRERRVLPCGL